MATLGIPDWGACFQASQIIGVLQAHSRTFMYLEFQGGRELFVMMLLLVTLLNARELRE